MSNEKKDKKNEVMVFNTDSGNVKLTIDIVRNNIAVGSNPTNKEIINFMMLCKARQLNPFIGECYLVKFGDEAQIITGKDVFLKRINKNPKCLGLEIGIIVYNSENNKIIERKGTFHLPNEELVGAYTIIKRKDWNEPFKWTISKKDYFRTYFNKKLDKIIPMGNWGVMPAVMLTKCCYVSAIRLTFPEDFGGMYDEAELNLQNENNNDFQKNTFIDGEFTVIDENKNNNSSNTTKTNNNVYDNENDDKMTQIDKETLYKLKKILFIAGNNNESETLRILKEISAFTTKDNKNIPGVDSFNKLTPGRIKATYGKAQKDYKEIYEQVKKELEEKKKKFEESKKENTKNDNKEDNNKKDEDNQELTDIVKPTEDKEESKK